MNEVMDATTDKLAEVLSAALSEHTLGRIKKQVVDIIWEIEGDIDWRMKEDLAGNLAAYVRKMAEDSIKALLEGEIGLMEHYLSCAPGYYDGRNRDHPVIHGKLFEYNPITLRKKIVDDYADLLKDQRILDLEDQVRSLVDQVNKLESRNQSLIERVNSYAQYGA